MLAWAVGVLSLCFLIKAYKDRKRLGCSIVIYLIILGIDLLVGGAIILWKCGFSEDEEECQLARGGTLGSLVIWLLVMLLFPFCMTKWSVCELLEGIQGRIKFHLDQIRPRKNRELVKDTELFLPSKPSIKDTKGYRITSIDENSNDIEIDDISIIPSGRGTVRGIPDKVYTSEGFMVAKEAKVMVKVSYTEVNET